MDIGCGSLIRTRNNAADRMFLPQADAKIRLEQSYGNQRSK